MSKTIRFLLSSHASDCPDVQLLLAFSLKKPREFIVAHPEYNLNFFEYLKFKNFLKKRKSGIPLAYITGHKDFFGLDFLVNKHTLVPRPDTEILVETVVQTLWSMEHRAWNNVTLIDVGTGSGCIPIAILKTIKQFDNLTINTFATDISKPALKIAKKNAKKNKVDIKFLHGNLLESLFHVPYSMFHTPCSTPNAPIIITANLPYLTQEQFKNEPSIQREPYSALVAEDNGLALYKKLLKQIKTLYTNSTISLFLEIDPSQSYPLTEYIKTIFPNAKIEIKKDLAGRDRVLDVELLISN